MNKDRISGNWQELKGKVQKRWGELKDDDIEKIDGDRERLVGRIRKRYGIARDRAEKQVDEFERDEI